MLVPDCDGVEAELIKALDDGVEKVCSGELVTQCGIELMQVSSDPSLHKKGDAGDCENYRTIALSPHASKMLLRIVNNRLRAFWR